MSGLAASRGGVSELELIKLGCSFVRTGGMVHPYGPGDRPDLVERAKSEIELRRLAMLKVIESCPKNRAVPMFVIIHPPPTKRAGECISCGDPLEPHIGGQCALCSIALHKALVASRRLPA